LVFGFKKGGGTTVGEMNVRKLRVTVWSEGLNGAWQPLAIQTYPEDINTCIAEFLGQNADLEIRIHDISEEENGLSQSILDETDVLVYWAHMFHDRVSDEAARRVTEAVLNGMGLLLLHSAKWSKAAVQLLGCNSNKGKYREIGDFERVWVVDPSHPICAGLEKEYIDIAHDEMYGEPFSMPTPDELVFLSWFEGGEVLRSGATWRRGAGKIFYFSPGHEEFPVYYHPEVQKVITNAVRWLRPVNAPPVTQVGGLDEAEPLNPLKNPIYPVKHWDKL